MSEYWTGINISVRGSPRYGVSSVPTKTPTREIKDRIKQYKYSGAEYLLGHRGRPCIGPLNLPARPIRWTNIKRHASFHITRGMIPRTPFSKKDWEKIKQFRKKIIRDADVDRIEIKKGTARNLVSIRLRPLNNTATERNEKEELEKWKALCHFITVIHDRSFIAATKASLRHGRGMRNSVVEKYPAPDIVDRSEPSAKSPKSFNQSRWNPADELIADVPPAEAFDAYHGSPTPAPLAKEVPPAREPLVLEGPPGIATVRKIWAFFTGKK